MKQRTLGAVTLVVIVLVVIVGIVWSRGHAMWAKPAKQASAISQSPIVDNAALGARAPEFQVATTAGLFDLNAATKPVLLEVFATWCPHCQRETGVLNALYAAYHARIAFVAVSGSDTAMDGSSPASEVDVYNFIQKFRTRYPIAYDAQLTVAGLYLQGGFPTLVIIDRNKIVRYLKSGEMPYATLSHMLDAVLR